MPPDPVGREVAALREGVAAERNPTSVGAATEAVSSAGDYGEGSSSGRDPIASEDV